MSNLANALEPEFGDAVAQLGERQLDFPRLAKTETKTPKRLRSDLRLSHLDAFPFGSMTGFGETYLPAFALALGTGEVIATNFRWLNCTAAVSQADRPFSIKENLGCCLCIYSSCFVLAFDPHGGSQRGRYVLAICICEFVLGGWNVWGTGLEFLGWENGSGKDQASFLR